LHALIFGFSDQDTFKTTSETVKYPAFESQSLLSQFTDFLLQCPTLKLS